MATAERDGDKIIVETRWTEKEQIKQVPGALWSDKRKLWELPLTWAACLQLRGIFGLNLEVGPQLTEWSWQEFNQRVNPSLELRNTIDRPDGNKINKDLFPFQDVGVEFLMRAGNALLGDELGTGKTIQALAALNAVSAGDALPALIICPNTVKPQWAKEAAKWFPEATPYVINGSAAARRKLLLEAKDDPTALVVMNIEAVWRFSRLSAFGSLRLARCRECDKYGEENLTAARCEVHPKELNGFGFKTVVLDEAHRIKEPKAKQTRAVWAVGHDPSVKRRWAMTGTPIADHVGDLWSIMHFVAPDEYPTKSKFVDRYALQSWNNYGGLDIVGVNPATRDEFFQILDPRFRRVIKAQVLHQLPPVVRKTYWVEMSPKQQKAYAELEKSLVTLLDNGEILIARNNLTKATRLLQLSSSYAEVSYEPDPENEGRQKMVVKLIEPSPKLDAMEEIIDELGDKPFVVAAESRQLIQLAAKRLEKRGITHGLIVGGMPDYMRQLVREQFINDELQAVLFTIKAGGTGVDGLQHADTLLCLQRSWSMIDNVQMEGRVLRVGSEKHDSVTIVDFVAMDSIEEKVQFPRLTQKFRRLEEINRDRARLIAAGQSTATLDEQENLILASSLGEPDREMTIAI